MFKKLKDKIAEEVKSSPHKIQQLTQTVTERIQNATSDESFFSIGEDDSSTPEPGFTSVSLSTPQGAPVRRNSSSSIASDISFLPRYESASNLYHLQSDLDVSASEIEDNVSTSSQLGHLSKEQIHAAFQKAQLRYHKYRGRYADIKNYYKELEKENGKIKQVLVETQDKALRRVAELREQCSLEQKAKAHLENALRLELDEKQYVIDTLKTKVNLLQDKNSNCEKSETLVNLDDGLANDLKTAQNEIETLNARLQEMKANTIVFNSKESDLKKRIAELEETAKRKAVEMDEVKERERENNLIIAQTKMELHTEIQNRDLEIQNLKHDLEVLKVDLDSYENKSKSTKLENLHSQNAKLIEKIDALTQKCKSYESESLKLEQLKIENEALKESDAKLKQQRDEAERQRAELNETVDSLTRKCQGYEGDLLQLEQLNSLRTEEQVKCQNYESELEQMKIENDGLKASQAALGEQMNENEAKRAQDYESGMLQLERLKIENDALRVSEAKMREEALRLGEEVGRRQVKFDEELATVREDTKRSLLDLESKIREKFEIERGERERSLQSDFEEKLRQVVAGTETAQETQLKLLETEGEVKTLACSVGELEGKLQALQERYNELERNHLELIEENSGALSELKTARKRVDDLEVDVPNLTGEVSRLQADVANLQSENLKLSSEASDLQERLSKYDSKISQLEATNSSCQSELEKLQQVRLRLELELENHPLRKEIEQLNALMASPTNPPEVTFNDSVLSEVAKTILSVADFQDQVRHLTEQNAALELKQCNRDEEASKTTQALRKKLKEQKAKFHADIQSLKGEVSEFREKNEEIQSHIDEYKQKLNEYEVASSQKSAQLRDLTNENGDLRDRLLKSDERVAVLSQEKDGLSHALRLKVDENANLAEEVRKLASDQNEKLTRGLATLREEHETQVSKLQDDHMIALQQEIAKLKVSESNCDSLASANSELVRVNVELEGKLKKSDEDAAHLRKTNDEVNGQLQSCQLELRTVQEKQEGLRDGNQQLQDEVMRLRQEEVALNEKLLTHAETSANYTRSLEEIAELRSKNTELAHDFKQTVEENDSLIHDLAEMKLKYETIALEKTTWEKSDFDRQELETIRAENEKLHGELRQQSETRDASEKELQVQLRDLENQFTEIAHERQLLRDEIQELKIAPINSDDVGKLHEQEINHLNDKLIQYKSLDLTNRTSIQFYENELQKLKNKNEKLNRKLDETLVTLNHCADLSNSTETEYLRNVLYNYMLGKEALVLARVIAAVCKFDDHQTEAILQREQQKQTLLGQLGFR
uniref:GRIP domain-containing protein n=1 Tax=Photinus pyralis TaxID=7054 RepID=A0A1Y1N6K8_PHOPY